VWRHGGTTAPAPGGTTTPRLALTVTEAAAALGVSDDFFHEHIAPELRWVRRGRRKLVSVRELETWLDRTAVLTLE
jgi:excisionase family DNA binding protein